MAQQLPSSPAEEVTEDALVEQIEDAQAVSQTLTTGRTCGMGPSTNDRFFWGGI